MEDGLVSGLEELFAFGFGDVGGGVVGEGAGIAARECGGESGSGEESSKQRGVATVGIIEPIPQAFRSQRVLAVAFEIVVQVFPCDASGSDVDGVLGRRGAGAVAKITVAKAGLHGFKVGEEGFVLCIAIASSPCHEQDGACVACMYGGSELLDGGGAALGVGVGFGDTRDLALFLEHDPLPAVKGILAFEEELSQRLDGLGVLEVSEVLFPEISAVGDAFLVGGGLWRKEFLEHGDGLLVESLGIVAVGVAVSDKKQVSGEGLCVCGEGQHQNTEK